jgi:uncharacterized protein (DUF2062 family)
MKPLGMPELKSGRPAPPSGSTGLCASLARGWRLLRGGESSPGKVAASLALGLFVGCLPLYGFHFPLCLAGCLFLRLDLVLAYLAANVSNPFVAPFLVTLEVEVGSYLLHGASAAFDPVHARSLGASGFFLQALAGSVVVGGALAALGAGLGWVFAPRRVKESSPLDAARERTALRYRGAKIFDRKYVEGKLWFDPVLPLLAELGLELGRVLDAGAGRGQLGLCLLELGQARTLSGFDLDARKLAVARQAAAGAATFEAAHLTSAELGGFDTLLLVDVLHYLRSDDQDALLERAARALEPGGRLLIRDTDAARRRSGLFTRLAERLAKLTGWHRGDQQLCFRPLSEIVARLEASGLRCQVLDASRGTPFSNALIVAERPLPA